MNNLTRILLIDDSSEEFELLGFAIKRTEYNIELSFVQDCDTAINKLSGTSTDKPDIIILDWNMPLIAGAECLSFIKKITQLHTIPIIVLSGYIHVREKQAALELGVTSFFNKPDSLKEYQNILEEIMKFTTI